MDDFFEDIMREALGPGDLSYTTADTVRGKRRRRFQESEHYRRWKQERTTENKRLKRRGTGQYAMPRSMNAYQGF